jgi:hypothetical protein
MPELICPACNTPLETKGGEAATGDSLLGALAKLLGG